VRRYPVANLLEATGLSLSALAQRVGIGGGEYARVRTEGVSELAADRWANRLGLHPAEVWPEYVEAGIREVMRTCAAVGCEVSFVSAHHARRFCSPRCRSREGSRRRYQNPEVAARLRERAAAYRAETLRVKRLKDAQYRARNRQLLRDKQRTRDQARRTERPAA
jgi:lambda repressor-like predicted transcriptional regulator